ncbi:uncharacterized protein H6S33_008791 [Morchella sextelata]|uniref:uncharacterized protein n=1 Tax=Morchella sextelata TaxID=1174677 RepID=UPI001D03E70B|nr:uncharacterized protein H6S33_008791 [Morchella sextelata]KAH0602452.1 hypothetical protein H6S33_008791 [Morchella sextelata]
MSGVAGWMERLYPASQSSPGIHPHLHRNCQHRTTPHLVSTSQSPQMALTLPPPTSIFCAARLPALQKAVSLLLAAGEVSPPPPPTDFTTLAPLSTLPVTITLHTPSTSTTTTTPTTLTVHRLLASQSSSLILLASLPPPHPPTLLIAKLRPTTTAAATAAHAHELSMLHLLTDHALFPTLMAHGTAGTQAVPLLLMQYLPHPSLAELLWDGGSALWAGEWRVGDKRALQRDGVLWGGLVAVVEVLKARGLRQGDLRGANVLYDVGGGRVWGVDLEGVVSVEGKGVDVQGVVEEFWRFELCAPGGRVW